MIALGDLAVRWPNIVEPYTEHMYKPLDDQYELCEYLGVV